MNIKSKHCHIGADQQDKENTRVNTEENDQQLYGKGGREVTDMRIREGERERMM